MENVNDAVPYKGPLTPAQAAEAIQHATRNARELLADAEFLFANGRWPRALALAVIGLEEMNKPDFLRLILIAGTDAERQKHWRSYRTHTKKTWNSILYSLLQGQPLDAEALRAAFEEGKDLAQNLEIIKQMALYTDVYDECKLAMPSYTIGRGLAEQLVSMLRVVIDGQPQWMSSEIELELLVKNIGAWREKGMDSLGEAATAMWAEGKEKGIWGRELTTEEMAALMSSVLERGDRQQTHA